MIDFQVLKVQEDVLQNPKDLKTLLTLSSGSCDCAEALSALKLIVGEKRLERIFKRQGRNGIAANEGSLEITKDLMHQILLGMEDIRFEDIQEMGGDGASTEQLDKIYNALLPNTDLKNLFAGFSQEVKYYDKVQGSGKTMATLEQRVWTILQHRQRVSVRPIHCQFEDFEMLSSRLGDREPPVGTVVILSSGYFAAEKIFAGGGAYVTVWRSLSLDRPAIVVCRGTAASRIGATEGVMSGISDILPELGFYGIRSIWPELKKYLEENEVRFIDVLGKSLGGAHAQYLATLITGQTATCVSALKTYCSVGTPESVNALFNKALESTKKAAPCIEVYRNIGDLKDGQVDYIPFVGGQHVHIKGNTRFFYVIPEEQEKAKGNYIEAFHASISLKKQFVGFMRSFVKAHARQNSLKEYSLAESYDIDLEANVGTRLEPWRVKMANVFNNCTFHAFQTETFEEFYSKYSCQLS